MRIPGMKRTNVTGDGILPGAMYTEYANTTMGSVGAALAQKDGAFFETLKGNTLNDYSMLDETGKAFRPDSALYYSILTASKNGVYSDSDSIIASFDEPKPAREVVEAFKILVPLNPDGSDDLYLQVVHYDVDGKKTVLSEVSFREVLSEEELMECYSDYLPVNTIDNFDGCDSTIDTHGLKMDGLPTVCRETNRAGKGLLSRKKVQVVYNLHTGELSCRFLLNQTGVPSLDSALRKYYELTDTINYAQGIIPVRCYIGSASMQDISDDVYISVLSYELDRVGERNSLINNSLNIVGLTQEYIAALQEEQRTLIDLYRLLDQELEAAYNKN